MITYPCPACKRTLRVPDDRGGKKAHCPACGVLNLIPTATGREAATVPPALLGVQALLPPPAGPSEQGTLPPAGTPSIRATLLTHGNLPRNALETLTATPSTGPLSIPGYEIERELGRGGMGVVYQARHTKLNRVVALKMILSGVHAGDAELAQLRTEAEAIASLQHPNIVQVYEIGEHDGKPFFSLEFCAGGTLDRKLKGTPLPPLEAAKLVETLALAMHAAHRSNVIHRDLKPANVLLTADGTPKITDFGLAKKLDSASGQTQSGAIMGTPSYMAPEQAGGKSEQVGPAADIYALGAILYELLTGRPPFKAATPLDTIMQVVSDEPVPPSKLQSTTPRDVETICLKCLHKEPDKRYASAAALAADLRRYQEGEPIAARPVGPWERAVKWVKRRPAIAALLFLLTVTVVTAFGLVTWKWLDADRAHAEAAKRADEATKAGDAAEKARQRAVEETGRADRERGRAEIQLARAEGELYFNHINLAQSELLAGNKDRAEELLDECRLDLRRWEWHYLRHAPEKQPTKWPGLDQPIFAAAFDPTGPRCAVLRTADVSVRDAAGAERFILKGLKAKVHQIKYRGDGTLIATALDDNTTCLWRASDGKLLHTLKGHTAPVRCLAFTSDGKTLVSGSSDSTAILWDVESGTERFTCGGHAGPLVEVACSPDGSLLATASVDKTVKLWNPATGRLLRTFRGHTGPVISVAFRVPPAEEKGEVQIASVGTDGLILWNAATGAVVRSLRGARGLVAVSPDGRRLVCPGEKQLLVWDATTGHEVLKLPLPEGTVATNSLTFSPDGTRLSAVLLSTGENGGIYTWDATPAPEVFALSSRAGGVADVAFSSTGGLLATAERGTLFVTPGRAAVWELKTAQETQALHGHLGQVLRVAFSPDGKTLATASADCTTMLWDPATGKLLQTLIGHTAAVRCVAWSPDGTRLATGSEDRTVRVWDTVSGKELFRLRSRALIVTGVAFSPDGTLLASASEEKVVHLWDPATGKELRTLPGRLAVAFSPDGKLLATGAPGSNDLKLIQVANGSEAATLRGSRGLVAALAFDPKGRVVAAVTQSGGVRVWDAGSAKEIVHLHDGAANLGVVGLAFSPDGRLLAAATGQHAHVWDRARWAPR